MWFLPTLNRPAKAEAVIKQLMAMRISTPGYLFINGGQQIDEYYKIELPKNWDYIRWNTNVGIVGAMNRCFKMFPNEPWYGLICDDEYLMTPEGDKELIYASGNWKIAHGNDGWQSENRIHTYVVMGGDLVRTLGWWALPGLWHWYVDDAWEHLAQELPLRVYCDKVRTEHRHFMIGKADKDEINQLAQSKRFNDREVFEDWKRNEADALIERIRKGLIW